MTAKDLTVKGSSIVLKRGTVFKGIRFADNDEEIEVREGNSTFGLKAFFLKKA